MSSLSPNTENENKILVRNTHASYILPTVLLFQFQDYKRIGTKSKKSLNNPANCFQ